MARQRPKRGTAVSAEVEARSVAMAHRPSTPPANTTPPTTPNSSASVTTLTVMDVDRAIPDNGQLVATRQPSVTQSDE